MCMHNNLQTSKWLLPAPRSLRLSICWTQLGAHAAAHLSNAACSPIYHITHMTTPHQPALLYCTNCISVPFSQPQDTLFMSTSVVDFNILLQVCPPLVQWDKVKAKNERESTLNRNEKGGHCPSWTFCCTVGTQRKLQTPNQSKSEAHAVLSFSW